MADQNVKINIGSSYNGEGMSKAVNSLADLDTTSKKATRAVGNLAGAFQGLGDSAGQQIKALVGGLQAFAGGGILGAVSAGIGVAVNIWSEHKKQVEANKKKMEEMKKKTEELNAAQKKLAREGLKDVVSQIETQLSIFDQIIGKWGKLATAAGKAQKSYEGVKDAAEDLEEAKLIESIHANIRLASTDDEKAIAKARGDVQLAKFRGKRSIARADRAVSYAKDALDNDQSGARTIEANRQAKVNAAKAKLKQFQDKLTATANDTSNGGKDWYDKYYYLEKLKSRGDEGEAAKTFASWSQETQEGVKSIGKQIQDIQKAAEDVDKATTEWKVAKKEVTVAEENYKKATIDAQVARQKAATEIEDAEDAERDLKSQIILRKQLTADKNKLLKEQTNLERKNHKEQKDIDAKIKKAKEDLAKATKEAADAQAKLKDANNNGGVYNPSGQGNNPNGVFAGGRPRPSANEGGAASNNTDNETNFNDFAKPAGWNDRWVKSHPKLAKKMGIKTSKELEKEAADADKKKKEQEDKVKALEAAKEKKKEDAYDAVVEIRDKLDALGLQ